MIDEVKAILKRCLYISDKPEYVRDAGMSSGYRVEGIDAAAQAIAEMVERQPVDRVRAMAALVYESVGMDWYIVPDIGSGSFEVWLEVDENALRCNCGKTACPHIQAIKLHLAQQEQANDL